MKIKKIEFEGHKVLGDLSIDLTDESGKPLDVVVFIGDNGTGKTQILKSIVDVFRLFELSMTSNNDNQSNNITTKELESDTEISNQLVTLIVDERKLSFEDSVKGSPFWTSWDDEPYKMSRSAPKRLVVWMPAELNIEKSHEVIYDIDDDFKVIEDASKWTLGDINKYIIETINGALRQAAIKKTLTNETYDDEIKKINTIFKDLDLNVKLDSLPSGIDAIPIFKTNEGKKIDIKQLSSGEKHLFFRMISLKSLNINNAIIIVDEPETSMHPDWQRKIIKVYESIGENNQIIMATHSPLILGSVKTEGVRKLVRNDEGKIELEPVSQTYGKNVEHLLKLTMDLDDVRDTDTAKKLKEASEMIKEGNNTRYNDIISELKEQLGTTDRNIVRLELEKAIKEKQHAKG